MTMAGNAKKTDEQKARYEREWQIELNARELFKLGYPTGRFARRLPQFRRPYPDPIGDHFRRLTRRTP